MTWEKFNRPMRRKDGLLLPHGFRMGMTEKYCVKHGDVEVCVTISLKNSVYEVRLLPHSNQLAFFCKYVNDARGQAKSMLLTRLKDLESRKVDT